MKFLAFFLFLFPMCIYSQSYTVEIDDIPYDTLIEYQSIVKETIDNGDLFYYEKEINLDFDFPYFDEICNQLIVNNLPLVDIDGFPEFPMQLVVSNSSYHPVLPDDIGDYYYSDIRYNISYINEMKVLIVEYKNLDIEPFEDTEVDISFQFWFWENGNIEVRFGDFIYPEPYFYDGMGYYDSFTDSYFGLIFFISSRDMKEYIHVGGNLNDNPIIDYHGDFNTSLYLKSLPKKNTILRFKKKITSTNQIDFDKIPVTVTNGRLAISQDMVFGHYFITNTQGATVIHDTDRTLDISQLLSGMYFISFISDSKIVTSKFFKN